MSRDSTARRNEPRLDAILNKEDSSNGRTFSPTRCYVGGDSSHRHVRVEWAYFVGVKKYWRVVLTGYLIRWRGSWIWRREPPSLSKDACVRIMGFVVKVDSSIFG